MTDPTEGTAARQWADALRAAALFAVDPWALGGITLRARVGPVRDAWLEHLRRSLDTRPVRRLPAHASEDRVLGGIDLAATLDRGTLVAERGLLADADGGAVIVPMAERLSRLTAACLGEALDFGRVTLERDGMSGRTISRIGVVLLDEGIDDEGVPSGLADRLAFHINLERLRLSDIKDGLELSPAASSWREVVVDSAVTEALCAAAFALGVESLRAPLLAQRVAQVAAAVDGRLEVSEEDVSLAARLVLGPRATRMPAEPDDAPEEPAPEPPPPSESEAEPEPPAEHAAGPLEDVVLEAAKAALPAGLLSQLALAGRARHTAQTVGTAGRWVMAKQRGRPAGTRRGHPRGGGRLNVVETLRAAAPWQRVRARHGRRRVEVRQDDFRVTRYKRRTETLTIFVVDASGSAALQRLAEAKGAVEQVLADCYVRRDHVALIAFRGHDAQMLLPPTRSLVRAKRCLAAMAGGGTTPIATGLDAARTLADDARRRGQTPVLVVMTDGRANVARDGQPDRARAASDAVASARLIQAQGMASLFVDTAPRPRPEAKTLSDSMGAQYMHLPYAEKKAISVWVEQVGPGDS